MSGQTKRPPDFDESDGLGLRLTSPGGGSSAMRLNYTTIRAERKARDEAEMNTEIDNIRLVEIATFVNSEHVKCESAARASFTHAVNIGKLLNEAKELTLHGGWGVWLKTNCAFSERTAQNYMRLAERLPELTAKGATAADLTYRDAVLLLSEPKDEPAKNATVADLTAGAWWWNLQIHEIGTVFPYDKKVIDAIAADMKTNGYCKHELPIVLFEGKVLDGKLRLEAAKKAGITPPFEIFNGDFDAAMLYAVRKNGLRASYTDEQIAGAAIRGAKESIERAGAESELLRIANGDGSNGIKASAAELLAIAEELRTLESEFASAETIDAVFSVIRRANTLFQKAAIRKLRSERMAGAALSLLAVTK